MLKEYFSSVRTYLDDRLSSPILGSFSFAWVVINWKLTLYLLFSNKLIEEKISYIENNYYDWQYLTLYPAFFVLFYTLILPWPTWWVQYLQETVNKKRRTHKIKTDTQYLEALEDKVVAQSKIDQLKLTHEMSQAIEQKRKELELERENARHNFEIERERKHLDFELEDRKRELEDRKQERQENMEHERRLRELEFEESKNKAERDLERYKADRNHYK